MLLFFAIVACTDVGPDSGGAAVDSGTELTAVELAALAQSPLPAVPPDPTNVWADDADAAWFGRWLFYDTRLSGSGEHSCATCHAPELGFGDGLALSEAAGTTARHAPTVLNTVYNDWMFWDGRADSHWAQALKPIEDPGEQATNRLTVAHLVVDDDELSTTYQGIFGDLPDLSDTARFPLAAKPGGDPDDPERVAWEGMSADDQHTINVLYSNLGKAIAAYERLLVREDAPFDQWATGLSDGDAEKLAAMSDQAIAGYELYLGEGNCHFCHTGPTFTNDSFHNVGLAWVPGTREDDLGRYDGIADLLADPFNGVGVYSDDPDSAQLELEYLVQGSEQIGQFKVPSLRNVAESPPYMHAGQFETLTEVVTFYSQLDQEPVWGHREDLMLVLDWSDEEIAAMVAFLESLTGQPLSDELMGPPDSPVPQAWRQ